MIKGGKGVFYFDTEMYLIIIGIILFTAVIEFFIYKLAEKLSKLKLGRSIKFIYASVLILYLFSNVLYAGASAYYYSPITKHNRLYPLYFPLTANRFLMKLNLVDYEKNRQSIQFVDMKNTNMVYPKHKLIFKDTISKKKNILFVCIDSWRSDCMSSEITPNIYKLSKFSQVFNQHYSGSNGTRGGIFSLFYGMPSTYWDNMKSNCISPVFINTLEKSNYSFGIFSCATLVSPAFDKTVFSHLKDIETCNHGNRPSAGDRIITDKFNSFLDKYKQSKSQKPFFGFVFYDSAHGYDYPDDFKTVFNPSLKSVNYITLNNDYDPIPFFNRYKNCLNYIDTQIERIIQKLEQYNLLENTLIVFTGDHGQEFNDNHKNYWGHNGNFSKYQIKVPMIIYDTELVHKQYTHKTSHYDLVPTMLSRYFYCANPVADYCIGKDLFRTKDWDYLISGSYMKYGIRYENKIINKYNSGNFEVTDLKLNSLSLKEINYGKLNIILKNLNCFYRK